MVRGRPRGLVWLVGTTGETALGELPASNADATWLKAGAAEVQFWGTDKAPSDAARPAVAVTAPPPKLGEPTTPMSELKPVLSTDEYICTPVASGADELNEFVSGPAEPNIETPEVTIDADEAAPEARLVPDAIAVEDVVLVEAAIVASGDAEDVEDAIVDMTPCRAPGTATEVSGDTVCAAVPAEVPAACATAAANPARPDEPPDEVVVGAGGVKGVNVDATDDAPA